MSDIRAYMREDLDDPYDYDWEIRLESPGLDIDIGAATTRHGCL